MFALKRANIMAVPSCAAARLHDSTRVDMPTIPYDNSILTHKSVVTPLYSSIVVVDQHELILHIMYPIAAKVLYGRGIILLGQYSNLPNVILRSRVDIVLCYLSRTAGTLQCTREM